MSSPTRCVPTNPKILEYKGNQRKEVFLKRVKMVNGSKQVGLYAQASVYERGEFLEKKKKGAADVAKKLASLKDTIQLTERNKCS